MPGLSQGEVRAVVRGRPGAAAQQVRVALHTAGELADAVHVRCGADTAQPRLRTSAVAPDGPLGDPLTTRVEVSASDPGSVTVVAVFPRPATVSTRTPSPRSCRR